MNYKLSPTVSVVKITDNVLEFFKTCSRQQVRIRVDDDTILNIVTHLDGSKSVDEIALEYNVNKLDVQTLFNYLQQNGIIDNTTPVDDFPDYQKYRRVIHFLSEYSISHTDLLQMWNNITHSCVLIVGCGAVGSWVACNLVETGVKTLIIMDGDIVEASNLHRQFGYTMDDIGQRKVDVLERRLKQYNPQVNINKCCEYLNENNLEKFNDTDISLIINCADKPNVDTTSLWIGEYAMRRTIPHIVGGGYNLHLSLIGQTVIPQKSACVKCFQKSLEEENTIDSNKVRKLAVKNRKVGSFAPMCSIIASMIGMEAIKIITRKIEPSNINRRGEFDIYTMDISYKNFVRRDDCEWCGKNGKYNYPQRI